MGSQSWTWMSTHKHTYSWKTHIQSLNFSLLKSWGSEEIPSSFLQFHLFGGWALQANLYHWNRTGSLYNWYINIIFTIIKGFLVAQMVKNPPTMQEIRVRSLGQEDTLENKIAAHSSLVAQLVNNLPAVQEMWVWSLGCEDPLEKEMATHSSILAWKI